MRVRCMACKTHWAVHAGDYQGGVWIYQCTNPDCNDDNGAPNHIAEKFEFGSIPSRALVKDTPGLRSAMKPEFQWWQKDYKRPAPQIWKLPQPGDSDFQDDNPEGLYWSGS